MTVKEFYEWCVARGVENYRLDCYGITEYGDVSYRAEVCESNIHVNDLYQDMILFEED